MGGRWIARFLLGSALLAASAGAQEAPHLLADINRSPYVPYSFEVHEEPEGFFNLGGRLFFSTANPDSLDQGILWSTDGTAEGTRQVSTTLCLSECESISPLGVVNGVALLEVAASSVPSSLARTDGTPGGTYRLGGDFAFDRSQQVFLMPGSGVFLLPTCDSRPDCRLWQSDTTRAGTGLFVGTDGLPFVAPHAFSFWRGRLYFVAMHGEGGEDGLWSTDGTPAGTLFLHDRGRARRPERTDGVDPVPPLLHRGGKRRRISGSPTARRPGRSGWPISIRNSCAVCSPPDVASMTATGDRVYFETHRAGHAIEIWESDGTPQGTRPRIELPARVLEASGFERTGGHWIFLAATSEQRYRGRLDGGRRLQPGDPPNRLRRRELPVGILSAVSSRSSPEDLRRHGRARPARSVGHRWNGRGHPTSREPLPGRLLVGIRLSIALHPRRRPAVPRLRAGERRGHGRGRAVENRRHPRGYMAAGGARRRFRRPERQRLLRQQRWFGASRLGALGHRWDCQQRAPDHLPAALRARLRAGVPGVPGRRPDPHRELGRTGRALAQRRHAGQHFSGPRLLRAKRGRSTRASSAPRGPSSSSSSTSNRRTPTRRRGTSSGEPTALPRGLAPS